MQVASDAFPVPPFGKAALFVMIVAVLVAIPLVFLLTAPTPCRNPDKAHAAFIECMRVNQQQWAAQDCEGVARDLHCRPEAP